MNVSINNIRRLQTTLYILIGIEDAYEVTRSRKYKKDRQYYGRKKKDKGQTMMYNTLHHKFKIQQRELH